MRFRNVDLLRTAVQTLLARDARFGLFEHLEFHLADPRKARADVDGPFELIVDREDGRNVDLQRTRKAIFAVGTRNGTGRTERFEGGRDDFFLCVGDGFEIGESLNIFYQMLHAVHAAQDGKDSRKRRDIAECPGRNGRVRVRVFEDGVSLFSQIGQQTAAKRFHDADRNIAFAQYFILFTAAVRDPVEIVELDEREVPRMKIGDLGQKFRRVVERETEIPDLSFLFFLLKEFDHADPFCVCPRIDLQIVAEVEIEVLNAALFELVVEDPGEVRRRASGVHRRHFRGEKVAFPRIFGQKPGAEILRFSSEVRVRRVEIVDSGRHRGVDELLRDVRVHRHSEYAETKRRKRKTALERIPKDLRRSVLGSS